MDPVGRNWKTGKYLNLQGSYSYHMGVDEYDLRVPCRTVVKGLRKIFRTISKCQARLAGLVVKKIQRSSNFIFNMITLRIGPFGNFLSKKNFFEKKIFPKNFLSLRPS